MLHDPLLLILAPLLAFLIVVLAAMPARKLAKWAELMDHPGGRKAHVKPIPPIGGLVIFPLFLAGMSVLGAPLAVYWPLYIGIIILLVTGALDDRFSLPWWVKFGTHITVAGLLIVFGNCQVAYLGDLFGFGVVWASILSYPFSFIAIVLLINALNLMDGLDGLAGGMSFVMFFWMMLAALIAGAIDKAVLLSLMMGCIAGFLYFNMRNPWRRQASIFLGDAGSMCLGLTLGWFAIQLARGPGLPLEPIAVAWIIGLPIFDACAQFYRRLRAGVDPFAPDRHHLHHHLIAAGFTVSQATVFIMTVVFVMGGIGYGGLKIGVPQIILTLFWVCVLLGHIGLSYRPERYVAVLSRLRAWVIRCSG